MNFVKIESIADVEPHVSFEHGFVVSRRDDHTVIDYVFSVDETFSSPVSLECRGLKFDRHGKIIGRPFHKFFNLGERERMEAIDWSAPHAIQDKLDGSMVHPVLLDDRMVFMTRMGATPQAATAQSHADQGVLDLSRLLLAAGITPIFEFTSPDNRIVVAYDSHALTLLGARQMVSGTYLPRAELAQLAARFGVPLVAERGRVEDFKSFFAETRKLMGIEGYVLAFDGGHRLKLKTEGYVLRHQALAGVRLEKNVLAWVTRGAVDDVVPILSEELAARVLAYQAAVDRKVADHVRRIDDFVAAHRELPRKDFAALAFKTFDKRLAAVVFNALDGKDTRQSLMGLLSAAAMSEPRVEAARDLIGATWSIEGLALPELEE